MRISDSIVKERRQKIVSLLQEKHNLSVNEISKTFHISEATARRDIEVLSMQNIIERKNGVAFLNKNVILDTPFFEDKYSRHMDEKNRIAKKAAERVQDGDVIFVNSGTTVLYLPKYITAKKVKIVTNNACMATAEGQEKVTLIITGGERYEHAQSLVGDIALSSLSKINANKCIISANGVSARYGITSSYYMETAVNETMLRRCNGERIVIADSSKIGCVFSFVSANIDMINTLITDKKADPEELERIARYGIEIVFADAE